MEKRRFAILGVLFFALMTMQFVSPVSSASSTSPASPNLEIEKVAKADTIITELERPAIFDLIIDNKGEGDYFQIYSLVGVTMYPKGLFYLPKGKTTLEIMAYPNEDLRKVEGALLFDYELRGENTGIFKDKLFVNIAHFEDSLRVYADDILPNDKEVTIKMENIKMAYIDNLDVRFQSEFFDFSKTVSFNPLETVLIKSPINPDEISKLTAGIYVVTATAKADGVKERFEGLVNYLEREGVAVNTTTSGLFLRKTTITKTNVGNVPTVVSIEMGRDIATRLFTGYSINPDVSDRGGFSVGYLWKSELQPGQSYSITSTTNYTFPFILIVLVILTGFFVKGYTRTPISIAKRVSCVKTKGGQLALKVRVHVKAKDAVNNVNLRDFVPVSTKLYGSIGKKPDSINEDARILGWNVGNLNSGEERVFSYIVYSNLKIIGRFELPLASASYEHGGEKKHILSNKTYFVAETMSVDAP